jgi:putative ABC transport system substrate-binding protein
VKKRRKVLIALGMAALAAPLGCFAQQRSKVARIALLEATSASDYAKGPEALMSGLRDRGYVVGKNIVVEYRWADGKYDRLPRLAAELVDMKLDVIVASGVAVPPMQQATAVIPIVMIRTSDPVGAGYVASLARPGRNITGLSNINLDVSSKYVELLRLAVPELSRVTVLVNPGTANHVDFSKRMQAAASTNVVKISFARAGTASQIEAAFAVMNPENAGALIVLPDSFFLAQAARIAELAAQRRVPTMFWTRDPVESGALMSYGQNIAEHYYRAATFVDKILKGANPGDLPVEQPTKIELVINLKTAKKIGLTIPQDLLLRADMVLE